MNWLRATLELDDNRMAAVAVAACNGVCWAGGGNEAWWHNTEPRHCWWPLVFVDTGPLLLLLLLLWSWSLLDKAGLCYTLQNVQPAGPSWTQHPGSLLGCLASCWMLGAAVCPLSIWWRIYLWSSCEAHLRWRWWRSSGCVRAVEGESGLELPSPDCRLQLRVGLSWAGLGWAGLGWWGCGVTIRAAHSIQPAAAPPYTLWIHAGALQLGM